MSIIGIIKRRQSALLRQFKGDPLVQVMAESPQVLPGLVFLDNYGEGAFAEKIGRRSAKNAAVVSRAGNPDRNASCWVKAGYGSYRKAYIAFINQVYGTKASSSDMANYDVDHLLNRGRTATSTNFIRVEAVRSDVNQKWGALFEKNASNPEFYANKNRNRRTMSWVICAKLGNVMPPSGPRDVNGIARLAAFFATMGFDRNEANDGIQSMLEFAYKLR